MEKPIVFLSHSSKNKRELVALKQLLDRKAVGFIDFFLSSDGESIPLGTNWVQRLNEALKKTTLMFVFVSRESLQSEWILFESGYAYGQDKHVVPYCLPGADLKHLPSPLKLLQAHTLHCAKDLNSLVKKCNGVFGTRIPEKFTAQEFNAVFRQIETPEEKTKPGAWEAIVDEIVATTEGPLGGADLFARICKRKHLNCVQEFPRNANWKDVTSSGVSLTESSEWFDESSREHKKGEERRQYTFTLSPKLFGLTAPLIQTWRRRFNGSDDFRVKVRFAFGIKLESRAHEFTQKLFGSEIEILDPGWLKVRNVRFSFRRSSDWNDDYPLLDFRRVPNLMNIQLPEIITAIAEHEILLLDRQLLKQFKAKHQ